MKKAIFVGFLLIARISTGIEIIGVPGTNAGTNAPINCNLRLANERIHPNAPVAGQQYCVGSMVSSSVLVTSAHCMNQVTTKKIEHLGNIPANVKIFIAAGGGTRSVEAEILAGWRSAVYDEEMATYSQRSAYINRPDVNKIRSDVVIIKLKTPVLPRAEGCPQLPTIQECGEFEAFAAMPEGPAKTYVALAATFYRSNFFDSGGGPFAKPIPYPGSSQVNAVPNRLIRSVRGFYSGYFTKPMIRFQVGDSGSGILLQKSPLRKLIMGTQSAKTAENGHVLFSNLCRLVNHPNYPLN